MEILNQTVVYVTEYISAKVFWLAFVPVIIGLVIAICTMDGDWVGFAFLAGLAALIVITILYNQVWSTEVPTDRYEYEVLIDDTYPASKLYEDYKVVDTRGKIWVIQDKVDDSNDVLEQGDN